MEDIQSLRDDWNILAKLTGNLLLTFEWVDSCLQQLHSDATPNFLVVSSDQGETCAIAPLVLVRRDNSTWLDIPGFNDLHEPVGLLYRDKAALLALFDAISRQPYPVSINRLWLNSEQDLTISPPTANIHGFWVSPGCRPSRYLKIQSSFDSFLSSLSSRRRYDYNRALRRAAKRGEVRHVMEQPDSHSLEPLFTLAMQIEDRSWKGREGSSLSKNKRLSRFFSTYLARPEVLPWVRVFFLYVGEKAVAMQICIEHEERLWLLKIGYDEDFQKCSPGLILMMEAVRYSFESGHTNIEFLGSSEPWLSLWSKQEREYLNLTHYPLTFSGLRAAAIDTSRLLRRSISQWEDPAGASKKS